MSALNRRRSRRRRFVRRTLPGAPPGILVPVVDAPQTVIRVLAYGPEGFLEKKIERVDEIPEIQKQWPVIWIDVDGLGDTTIISEIGRLFEFHKLALEDVVHTHQRAKVERYDRHLFAVARMPITMSDQPWRTEQISFFLGERYLVTFQERTGGDCLDCVRLRIRTGLGRVRPAGPDYLMYALLDAILDNYFPLVEDCGERLDVLETEAFERPASDTMSRLHQVKRDLLTVRRAVWPMRDALHVLLREESTLVTEETRVFLRDCHDHTIQIIDLVEAYRDVTAGLTDLYVSALGMRTNEIMRVLTVISTIFIPLTFIVGLYGMNFEHMPELHMPNAYPIVLLVMLGISAGLLIWFHRSGWLRPMLSPPTESAEIAEQRRERAHLTEDKPEC